MKTFLFFSFLAFPDTVPLSSKASDAPTNFGCSIVGCTIFPLHRWLVFLSAAFAHGLVVGKQADDAVCENAVEVELGGLLQVACMR